MTTPLFRRILKMNGAGNRIDVLDLRDGAPAPTSAEVRAIHAAPGLAFDQLMVASAPRSPETRAFVRIFNNDGSEVGACGNGTRCVAWALMGAEGGAIRLETHAGLLVCERLGDAAFRVDMGPPRLAWNEIPFAREIADTRAVKLARPLGDAPDFGPASLVNMGNPHAVFFVPDVALVDLARVGRGYETSAEFPEKANISFAQILGRDAVRLRVWERGVGATLACGSAACATVVAAARRGLTARRVRVELPGGELLIEWRDVDDHVLMTGPVEFEGAFDVAVPA